MSFLILDHHSMYLVLKQTMSLSLLPFLMWLFPCVFSCGIAVLPSLQAICRKNCSICSCSFAVSLRGGKLRIFLVLDSIKVALKSSQASHDPCCCFTCFKWSHSFQVFFHLSYQFLNLNYSWILIGIITLRHLEYLIVFKIFIRKNKSPLFMSFNFIYNLYYPVHSSIIYHIFMPYYISQRVYRHRTRLISIFYTFCFVYINKSF